MLTATDDHNHRSVWCLMSQRRYPSHKTQNTAVCSHLYASHCRSRLSYALVTLADENTLTPPSFSTRSSSSYFFSFSCTTVFGAVGISLSSSSLDSGELLALYCLDAARPIYHRKSRTVEQTKKRTRTVKTGQYECAGAPQQK
jgi:hypothetical protein